MGFGVPLLLVSDRIRVRLALCRPRCLDRYLIGKWKLILVPVCSPRYTCSSSIGLLKKRKKAKTSPEPAVADKGKGKAAAASEVQKKDKVEAGPAAVAATA